MFQVSFCAKVSLVLAFLFFVSTLWRWDFSLACFPVGIEQWLTRKVMSQLWSHCFISWQPAERVVQTADEHNVQPQKEKEKQEHGFVMSTSSLFSKLAVEQNRQIKKSLSFWCLDCLTPGTDWVCQYSLYKEMKTFCCFIRFLRSLSIRLLLYTAGIYVCTCLSRVPPTGLRVLLDPPRSSSPRLTCSFCFKKKKERNLIAVICA